MSPSNTEILAVAKRRLYGNYKPAPFVVVRGLLLAVLPATFGLALFARRGLAGRRGPIIGTVAALLLSGVAFVLMAAAMTGAGVAELDREAHVGG